MDLLPFWVLLSLPGWPPAFAVAWFALGGA